MKNAKKKPVRWAYLDELDAPPTDDTPVRSLYRRPAAWEWTLYGAAALLWMTALLVLITERDGATGLTMLGLCAFCLRLAVFELRRRKRCAEAVLGTVESFTRRPHIRRSARYPVIRFEVAGAIYPAFGHKPAHPSTLGNEEWVHYNPQDPADCFAAKDSKPRAAVGLTALTAFLGVALLILELN